MNASAWAVASLFGYAAFAKLVDPRLFIATVTQVLRVPWRAAIFPAVVAFTSELAVSVLSFAGLTNQAMILGSGLLVLFCAVSLLRRDEEITCSCFGHTGEVLGVPTALRNGVMAVLCIYAIAYPNQSAGMASAMAGSIIALLVLLGSRVPTLLQTMSEQGAV